MFKALFHTLCIFLVIVPWTVFWSSVGLLACAYDKTLVLARYWVGKRFYNPFVLFVSGLKTKVEGVERLSPGEPVLFVANHQGFFDIPALVVALPCAVTFVTMRAVFKVPLFGKYLRKAGHIPVEKGKGREVIREAVARIRAGDHLVIFPEGRHTRDGSIGEFKNGFVEIARQAGVRVVPMALTGSFEAYNQKSKLIHPGTIRVQIGSPVDLSHLENPTEDIRSRIIQMRQLEASYG